jgi:hypothetical protein
MNRWLKPSNGLALVGVSGITAGLWHLGIGWACGWLGVVSLSFGAFLSRKGF